MSAAFRRHLAQRLVSLAALAAPVAASSSISGCGCDDTNPDVRVCFDPTTLDAGAPLDAGPTVNGCPTASSVVAVDDLNASLPASSMLQMNEFKILSGPVAQGGDCCYVVQAGGLCGGRPFLVDDRPLVAPPQRHAGGWSDAEAPSPRTGDLSPELRGELAEAWTRDGLAEHASVASFARFSLELLAAGAPANLVELAHRAALDEVHHARLCFSLAGAYAGQPVGPGAFPIAGGVEVTSDLASLAARVTREGCVGETIAAVLAAEQRSRAADPAVRVVLAILAADEARHAELAWRTVAWAMRTGGAPVRAAVAAVLSRLDDDDRDPFPREGPLDRHGRLDGQEQRRVAARAIVEVVRPAARALLRSSAVGSRLTV